jgi:hypothetical protein
VATVDQHLGIYTGSWNPSALDLPSAKVLNMNGGGSGFYSPKDGESST